MKNKILDFLDKYIVLVVAAIMIIVVFFVLSGCKGCKQEPAKPIDVVTTIVESVKPMEDSLRKEVAALKDSIAKFKQLAEHANVEKKVALSRANNTLAELNKAKANKDTVKIVTNCEDFVQEHNDYVEWVIEEDIQQQKTIDAQATTIRNHEQDLQLQAIKLTAVATENLSLKQSNAGLQVENTQLRRKVKRRGNWLKVSLLANAGQIVKDLIQRR